jgi:hypothetical protein
MRILFALVITIATAGCGGDNTTDGPDMQQRCSSTIKVGDPCNNGCGPYIGDHCYCGHDNKWTCDVLDMTTHD